MGNSPFLSKKNKGPKGKEILESERAVGKLGRKTKKFGDFGRGGRGGENLRGVRRKFWRGPKGVKHMISRGDSQVPRSKDLRGKKIRCFKASIVESQEGRNHKRWVSGSSFLGSCIYKIISGQGILRGDLACRASRTERKEIGITEREGNPGLRHSERSEKRY